MLEKTKCIAVRIHLVSGNWIEAKPEEVMTIPPLGTAMLAGDGKTLIPINPSVVVVHKKGEELQQRFFGCSIELVEKEALIVEATKPPLAI